MRKSILGLALAGTVALGACKGGKKAASKARKVAVERNLEIVPRSTFGDVQVAAGDRYEIVHFVGGG